MAAKMHGHENFVRFTLVIPVPPILYYVTIGALALYGQPHSVKGSQKAVVMADIEILEI
jgi:hypothetical protein